MSSQIVNVEWKSKNFWQNKVSEIRVSKIRVSEIRGSEIRGSEIRVSKIRVREIRVSSNHRELHGAIFCQVNWLLLCGTRETFCVTIKHHVLFCGKDSTGESYLLLCYTMSCCQLQQSASFKVVTKSQMCSVSETNVCTNQVKNDGVPRVEIIYWAAKPQTRFSKFWRQHLVEPQVVEMTDIVSIQGSESRQNSFLHPLRAKLFSCVLPPDKTEQNSSFQEGFEKKPVSKSVRPCCGENETIPAKTGSLRPNRVSH